MVESDHRYYKRLRADMARWPIKLLNNIKRRCKLADIPCTLTVAVIKIPEHCPVLSIPIFIGTVPNGTCQHCLPRIKWRTAG